MKLLKDILFAVKDFLVGIKDVAVGIVGGASTVASILAHPESLLFLTAIVGFFFIMGGCKKWGCRITSGSIIGMLIMRLIEVI